MCEGGMQIIVLGTGEEKYENLFRHYAWKYPDKVSANIYFSNEMSHKIYAGCDAFLMPSLFEPCGLSQIISMRYGTLPIVRETGGLKDTVIPYNEYTGEGTGFSFANFNSNDMFHVIKYAMQVYYDNKTVWQKLVKQAMSADYSWSISAEKYIKMYSEITGIEYKKPEEKNKEESITEAEDKISEGKKEKSIKKPAAKRSTRVKEEEKVLEEIDERPKKKAVGKTQKEDIKTDTKTKEKKQISLTQTEQEKKKTPAKKNGAKSAANKASSATAKKTAAKKEKETPALIQEEKTTEKKIIT